MPGLFDPITLGSAKIRNRIAMSPMCQYKAAGNGIPTLWHDMHYRSRASGGTGLILSEMTDVSPGGRITEGCLGLWNQEQTDAFSRIAEGIREEGSCFGIQLSHAGRKSLLDGEIVGPSAIPFSENHRTPRALKHDEIAAIIDQFAESASRAAQAGVDVIELHGAHGYLIHQFISPMSNQREDEYGDPTRLATDIVNAIKAAIPSRIPLIFRLSAVEYGEGSYGLDLALEVAAALTAAGVDAFDITTGGNGPVRPGSRPGSHLRYSQAVRQLTRLPVIAVGEMHHPGLADFAIREGFADIAAIGRALLRNPHWAYEAARELHYAFELPGEYAKGRLA